MTTPDGWRTATLGEFMVERGGSVAPAKFPDETFELYSIPAHDGPGYEMVRGADIGSSKRIVEPGDVMVSKIVPHIQRARVVGPDSGHRQIASTEWISFRSDAHDPHFLRYFLLSSEFHGHFMRTVSGVGGSLNRAQPVRVKSIRVAVPPLDEQRRIVEILEDHLSHLDAAADYESAALRRLSALRRSALDAHFGTRGEGVRLDDLIVEITAGKSFGSSASPAAPDEWGIIKVSAMTWGEFDPTQNKAVPATSVDTRYEIKAGDLLVSRANTSEYVGASVLVGDTRPRLLLSDKSLRITPKPSVRTEWLWRALQSPSARRQISSLATGTKDSMRNISQGSLRSVVLPTADAAEQSRSLAAYEEVEVGQQRLASQLELQSKRLLALRRAVLAAAFEGKLTGRQSDTEVIEELAHEA